MTASWRLVIGWLSAGWRSSTFGPVQSVHTVGPSSRSRRALKAGVGRSWALTRGQFCDCTIHETAKTTPNTQNSRSSSTKTPILCSKRPKIGVPKGKSAQKPQFCAREEGDWQWEEMILASGSATVAFLQITAHTSKMQTPHNQIINFYQLAR